MEMKAAAQQDSEGDLRAWLELLAERHIIEPSLPPTAPLGKWAPRRKNILIRGGIDYHLSRARGNIQARATACVLFDLTRWTSEGWAADLLFVRIKENSKSMQVLSEDCT